MTTLAAADPDEPDPLTAGLGPASADQGIPGHDTARTLARGARAVQLRILGLTYEQIAEREGYAGKSGARQAVERALKRHEAEAVAELRVLENARLDADEVVLRSIIGNTNVSPGTRIRAIDRRTRLSARRSRMNGLDAPVAVQMQRRVQAELEDALAELHELVMGEVTQVVDAPYDEDGPNPALPSPA